MLAASGRLGGWRIARRSPAAWEAALTGGFAAEVAARLAGEGLTSLLAPIERVAGYDTVMPLPRLEHHYMPSVERILTAARRALEYR